MNFREKTKKFFTPFFYDPRTHFRAIFEGASDGIYLVTSLYYFEQIIRAIQTSDEVLMDHLLVIYGSIVIAYLVIKVFIRHWGWGEICASMSRFLVEKYLSRYIEAEPNITEKIGTGRFIAIFTK